MSQQQEQQIKKLEEQKAKTVDPKIKEAIQKKIETVKDNKPVTK